MHNTFKEYTTQKGKTILYVGTPKLSVLETVAEGPGDIWHSSLDQGYKNAFEELVYFTATFWWYINDFEGVDTCVNWRINPNAFAVRKEVWEQLGSFDSDFKSLVMQAFDFGYNALRSSGAIPLYVKDLYDASASEKITFSIQDRYIFFRKNFKHEHSLYMLFRKGIWKWKEWQAFSYARNNFKFINKRPVLAPRSLNAIQGAPTVSYVIPTMLRQEYTLQLLQDLALQNYLPTEVVIVDATPENERNLVLYEADFPFEVVVKWQITKGSCRARNEAITLCTGDYIVFGDDDIRILPDFIEKHITLLQTYNAPACNGLDIMAAHLQQDKEDLKIRLKELGDSRWIVGASRNFSNANSCVKKEFVDRLVGNDINFDGGYGEDGDFGLSLVKAGGVVLYNPFSANLHLKPPSGGYRWWGAQAKIMGKKRKQQPWELDTPIKWIRPVPSPTMMYMFYKHFTQRQIKEYKYKYFFLYLFKKNFWTLPLRLLNMPLKLMQFSKSRFYAKKLMKLGIRHE